MMNIKKNPILWTIGNILMLICLSMLIASYHFAWPDTGFENKTIWDWLQLIIVPLALGVIALLFNQSNTFTERQIAQDRYEHDRKLAEDDQKDTLYQKFADFICEMILDRGLLTTSQPGDLVRLVTRDRTIGVLMQLDGRRTAFTFAAFREINSMDPENPIIDLNHTSFARVHWSDSDLSGIAFRGINFTHADLNGTTFQNIDFRDVSFLKAHLIETDFEHAHLENSSFQEANLRLSNFSGATLTNVSFVEANLDGAIFHDAEFENIDFRGAKIDKRTLTSQQQAQCHFV